MFCKGADVVIAERLALTEKGEVLTKTYEAMEAFALDGLRTLTVAARDIDARFFEEWQRCDFILFVAKLCGA